MTMERIEWGCRILVGCIEGRGWNLSWALISFGIEYVQQRAVLDASAAFNRTRLRIFIILLT